MMYNYKIWNDSDLKEEYERNIYKIAELNVTIENLMLERDNMRNENHEIYCEMFDRK